MKWLYLLIDGGTISIPLLFSFHPKLKFSKNAGAFFKANILVAPAFIAWDICFTRLGVWGFNPQYLTGIYLENLPVEEILFFTCIPFACLFTYHCLNRFFTFNWPPGTESWLILLLASVCFITGFLNLEKAYTASTFISLALVLLIIKYIFKITWLPKLLSIYPVLLIPFFIVNGILTGSGLEQPVVWYNDTENLGIRLFTIPVEDVFYGFELILLHVWLYHYFSLTGNKSINRQTPMG